MNRRIRIPEKAVQSQIVNLLRSVGASVYVIGTRRPRGEFQGTRQTPGIPDIYAFLPPPRLKPNITTLTPVWIEVKAADGRLRPEQADFQDQCARTGGVLKHVVGGVDQVVTLLVAGGWLRADGVAHYRHSEGNSPCTK
jgi:hypothetical protein